VSRNDSANYETHVTRRFSVGSLNQATTKVRTISRGRFLWLAVMIVVRFMLSDEETLSDSVTDIKLWW
jgi:hypothetical protein